MKKELVAVTGEYQNQQGEQKAEFTKIGVIMTSQNGKEYALLDPSISLSGVMAKQNALAVKKGEAPSSNIMCSVMQRDNNQQGQQGGYQQQPQQNGYQQPQQGQQGYQQNGNGPQF